MRQLLVGGCLILLLNGCSTVDSPESTMALPASSSSSVAPTTTVLSTTTTVTTTSLASTTTTLVIFDSEPDWPQAPDIWHPVFSPYLTIDPDIEFWIYAADTADVFVGSVAAEPVQDWAGGKAMFVATVRLGEGPNAIDVNIDGVVTEFTVVQDPSLQHMYGRVLDTWARHLEIGIDFGEMDFEPDYGQGDFFPGEVVVDFKQLSSNVVLINNPFWEWESVTSGDDTVWDYFAHGDASHNDVWNIILDEDTVLQLEGPIPLGD